MAQNFFNAATQIVTIFDADGKPHETSRLNARDLISTNGFHWNAPAASKPLEAPVEEVPVEEAPEEPVEEAPEAPDTSAEDAPFDPNKAPLAEVAERLVGTSDVAKYLEGFTVDALRVMAEERFGQKAHHKISKSVMIDKIVLWEAQKTSDESSEV